MKRRNEIERDINIILNKYWGYKEFRPMQREIINSILSGRDTLALLPTGGGKSITYQVPALAMDGVCIVITPLIALMKDQVDRLRQMGIPATAIHSGLSPRQIEIALDNCTYGDTKFLYVAPERVSTDAFKMRLHRMKVSLIAVDEAHCISQWGYDFRPSYLRIASIREITPNTPILALTASATELVCDDIMANLKFSDQKVFRGDFTRANLSYSVRHVEDKDTQLMRVINNVDGSGIVYVRTRAGAETVAKYLNGQGVSTSFYHGGLPHTERSIRQDEWLTNRCRVMVATNAFGMGIDKADVRFVVHYTMCDSLESYYQEAGRAGRDGKRSYALLMVEPEDNSRIETRFEMDFPKIELIKTIYDTICSKLQVAYGEGGQTSFLFNIYEFCAENKLSYGCVSSALKILQLNNYMTLSDETRNPARIMFCVSRDDLYKIRVCNKELDPIIRIILRLYEGVFAKFCRIDESEIAKWSGYSIYKVKDLLKQLWRMRLIRYTPSNQSPILYLESDRLPKETLYISPESYMYRKQLSQERFSHMLEYANNESECRSIVIDNYFGGKETATPCGVCDICLNNKKKPQKEIDLSEMIISLVNERKEMSLQELISTLSANQERVIAEVDRLIEKHVIEMNISSIIHLC